MTYTTSTLWIVILAVGVGTFALRASGIFLLDKWTWPAWMERILRYVPAAVLSAIISTSLFVQDDSNQNRGGMRIAAALLAAFVAYKTKSLLWTILSGMVTLWLLILLAA